MDQMKKFIKDANRPLPMEKKENKIVENQEKTNYVETSEEKKVENIHNTNYLELCKEKKENLKENGILFKHGTVVKCNQLNFREKADKLSKVIHTFALGEEILYSETESPDWFIVKDKEKKIGYCMSEFIKIEQ